MIVVQQTKRTFVEKVDFVTSAGHLTGEDARKRLNLPGKGPVAIITDLGILQPEPGTNEFVVTELHPSVSRAMVEEATGWPVRFSPTLSETPVPSDHELKVLRNLLQRSSGSHGER